MGLTVQPRPTLPATQVSRASGTTLFRTGFLRAQSSCEEAAWTHRQLVQLSGSLPALEVFRHVWRAWAQFSHDANWRAEQLWTEALISPQAGTWARYRPPHCRRRFVFRAKRARGRRP